MKTEITPESIINARKEKTYCDGCKYVGEGTRGEEICYRIIAKSAACAREVKYWKCAYANRNNECKFYKVKSLEKKEFSFLFIFFREFFRCAGVAIITLLILRLIWRLFTL